MLKASSAARVKRRMCTRWNVCVCVKDRERNHPPTPPLLKCVVLYFTEGRQVNEKLSILSPSPRRRAKATLILPNFVFAFFWRPVRSVVTPVFEGTGEQRHEGSVRAVMPSVAVSGEWREDNEGEGKQREAVKAGPAPLPSFGQRHVKQPSQRTLKSCFTIFF